MTERNRKLYLRMIAFDQGRPALIQHFTKVHAYAALIAESEGMEAHAREVLEAAALVHDIAIPLCREKYGDSAGPRQEQEGPALVRGMLPELGFDGEEVERVCWLVAHHHTLSGVTQLDHRILLEADLLVNAFEHDCSQEANEKALEQVFRTETGKRIFRQMFALRES